MNNTLLQQITRKDAKAFTHSGKFRAAAKFPKIMTGSYLTLDAESMIIIRKTAGSVKTECRMRRLDCSGSSLVPES